MFIKKKPENYKMAPTDPVAAGQEECNYCKKTINNNLQCESSYHPSCAQRVNVEIRCCKKI